MAASAPKNFFSTFGFDQNTFLAQDSDFYGEIKDLVEALSPPSDSTGHSAAEVENTNVIDSNPLVLQQPSDWQAFADGILDGNAKFPLPTSGGSMGLTALLQASTPVSQPLSQPGSQPMQAPHAGSTSMQMNPMQIFNQLSAQYMQQSLQPSHGGAMAPGPMGMQGLLQAGSAAGAGPVASTGPGSSGSYSSGGEAGPYALAPATASVAVAAAAAAAAGGAAGGNKRERQKDKGGKTDKVKELEELFKQKEAEFQR